MTAFILKTDINQLCFEAFYWGYLIDSKVSSANLIKQELLWDRLTLAFLKGPIDGCSNLNL